MPSFGANSGLSELKVTSDEVHFKRKCLRNNFVKYGLYLCFKFWVFD